MPLNSTETLIEKRKTSLLYRRLAFLISVMMHPLLLPSLCFFILFFLSPISVLNFRSEAKWGILTVIFVMTFLAPMSSILLFYASGSVKSLKMDSIEDRKLPFMVTILYYLALCFLFIYFNAFRLLPDLIKVILASTTLSLILVTAITFYWKISAHTVGSSGVLGFLFAIVFKYSEQQLFIPVIATFLCTGLLMSARLYLNAHTPRQILAGFLLGFTLNFLSIIIFA